MPQTDKPLPIEDYGMIGDCLTSAIVGRNGSIDWLCWPRFDSAACFAALLGSSENGRWKIAPDEEISAIRWHYRDGSMVLETIFTTGSGEVALIDFMPVGKSGSSVVRIVEGRKGRVRMSMHMKLRFDYGISVPWVIRLTEDNGVVAVAGPELAVLRADVELQGEDLATVALFEVGEGERKCFVMSHGASHLEPPPPLDAVAELEATEAYWRDWSSRCIYQGRYRDAVKRSIITLKGLTYAPTGGIVAAATSSLPEQVGGKRNWDYRFCWLRDATLTLFALMNGGYYEEAQAWRDWLQRSIAGSAEQIQIMYGLGGERRLDEWEVDWLSGYLDSKPVRVGNAASGQLQLDVYGEVIDALFQAREGGLEVPESCWSMESSMMEHLERIWREPDEGLWETRGGRKHFTFSKVMVWVALDRMIRNVEKWGMEGPVERWRKLRDEVHATVCKSGFDTQQKSFVQAFGEKDLDASLLLLPLVGFLPPDDERIRGTVAAVERDLLRGGFVMRYKTQAGADGLPPGEGAFLACSFWLADNYAQQGRRDDARAMFERLIGLQNDLGLLSEEYDVRNHRLIGNFPQAFSHVALVGTAMNLWDDGPTQSRAGGGAGP